MNLLSKYSLILSTCLATDATASDMAADPLVPAAVSSSTTSNHGQLAQQAQEVKAYASKHPNLTLVLGDTTDNFVAGNKRYDDSYVFLDDSHTKDLAGRKITADFNNLTDLAFLSANLGNTFSRILLDTATYHHTHWTLDHLQHFKAMLQPQGVFQFEMFTNGGQSTEQSEETYDAFKKYTLQKLSANQTDIKLPKTQISYIEPNNLKVVPHIPADVQSKIDAQVRSLQELLPFALTRDEQDIMLYGETEEDGKFRRSLDQQKQTLQSKLDETAAALISDEDKTKIREEITKIDTELATRKKDREQQIEKLEKMDEAMQNAKAAKGLTTTYTREDLEDQTHLRQEFVLEHLSEQLTKEMFQLVYYPHARKVLAKVFSTVEIKEEPYPQYPNLMAVFVKAVK